MTDRTAQLMLYHPIEIRIPAVIAPNSRVKAESLKLPSTITANIMKEQIMLFGVTGQSVIQPKIASQSTVSLPGEFGLVHGIFHVNVP